MCALYSPWHEQECLFYVPTAVTTNKVSSICLYKHGARSYCLVCGEGGNILVSVRCLPLIHIERQQHSHKHGVYTHALSCLFFSRYVN